MNVFVPNWEFRQQSGPPPTVALSTECPTTSMSPDAVTNTRSGKASNGDTKTRLQTTYPALSSEVSHKLRDGPPRFGFVPEVNVCFPTVAVPRSHPARISAPVVDWMATSAR